MALALFEGLSVRKYLTLKKKDADPAQYLEMVGLHPATYLDRMTDKTLSGGERKRVQAWLEFDVDDIEQAGTELIKRGYTLLTKARKEPWGQIVTRLLSPEGLLVAVTVTPEMREQSR